MANDLTLTRNLGAVSTRFANVDTGDDLGAGIASSFGIISYKGKVWAIRHRGEENKLMREDGDGPRSSIEVVVLKAPANIAKMWYANGYVEGSSEAPDCASSNGVTPDAGVRNKQSDVCATCPKNAWGSAITPAGKQAKACSDYKRLAVAPLGDLRNERFGGPMLLRIPAGSLAALKSYSDALKANGYPYFAVGTRVAFDVNEAFPKFVFTPIRPLTDDEANTVIALRDDPQVQRILSEEAREAPAAQATPPAIQFEQPTPTPTPKREAPAPTPKTAEKPVAEQVKAAAAPVEEPAPEKAPDPVIPEAEEAAMPADLDAKLNALLG